MTCKEAFDIAVAAIKVGDYLRAREIIRNNPKSDQRIIERRIEQAISRQDQQS